MAGYPLPSPMPGEVQDFLDFVVPGIGLITHNFQNQDTGTMVVTDIDFTEVNPVAGDTFAAEKFDGATQFYIVGGGVGTGHVGPFSQHWDGVICLQNGQSLRTQTLTTAGASWHVHASGFFIPQTDTYTLTQTS